MCEDREEVFERVGEAHIHGETIDDSIRILGELKEEHNEEYYELSLRLGLDGEDHIVLNLFGRRKEDDTERKERIDRKTEFDRANEEWRVKEEKKEKEELARLAKKYRYHLEEVGARRRNMPCP